METEYKIDSKSLEKVQSLTNVKYSSLFNTIGARISERPDLVELVQKESRLFSTVYHAVREKLKNIDLPSMNGNNENFRSAYSAFISSGIVSKDVEKSQEQSASNIGLILSQNYLSDKQLVIIGETDYSLVKSTLYGLTDFLLKSKKHPADTLIAFCREYSNQANSTISQMLPANLLKKIKEIKWSIGPYKIDGLHDIIAKDNGKNVESINEKEHSQFYTPLKELAIPQEKLLQKERIVGDKETLLYLERMSKCLFMYNQKAGENPMMKKRLFNNKILLQGLPGGGKGAVCWYALNYAKTFGNKIGADLMITHFDIDSSYEDGKIQKLKSQLKQLTEENRLFFVYEEEIDSLLMNESKGLQKKSDLQVVTEFNKFMDGHYADRGNYIFLGDINDMKNLRSSNISRMRVINWQGAITMEEKTRLLSYKLENGIENGYVNVSDSDFRELGKTAYKYNLSGRDITKICEKAESESFKWNNLGEVYDLMNNYEKQLKHIDSLHEKITYGLLISEITLFAENRVKAIEESKG